MSCCEQSCQESAWLCVFSCSMLTQTQASSNQKPWALSACRSWPSSSRCCGPWPPACRPSASGTPSRASTPSWTRWGARAGAYGRPTCTEAALRNLPGLRDLHRQPRRCALVPPWLRAHSQLLPRHYLPAVVHPIGPWSRLPSYVLTPMFILPAAVGHEAEEPQLRDADRRVGGGGAAVRDVAAAQEGCGAQESQGAMPPDSLPQPSSSAWPALFPAATITSYMEGSLRTPSKE
jgi:hypothetical protein